MSGAYRRRYKRYAPKALTFAVLNEASAKVGSVVSVSQGGLAFQYTTFDLPGAAGERAASPNVELIIGPSPWFVSEIPCEIIYDFEMENDHPFPTSIEKRCCGLKFGELSEEQAKGLETLLKDHVVRGGLAPLA